MSLCPRESSQSSRKEKAWMSYLIDTNICIYLINKRPQNIIDKVHVLGAEQILISSITVAELEYGISKSASSLENKRKLEMFLLPFEILVFDKKASEKYGNLRIGLEKRGELIGPLDMLIAAQALAHSMTVVTNNEKGFRRVKGLSVENWV